MNILIMSKALHHQLHYIYTMNYNRRVNYKVNVAIVNLRHVLFGTARVVNEIAKNSPRPSPHTNRDNPGGED